ncbi:DNA alkylation repair protein [Aureibaculum sp. A20]|uniref:DNA alkylation repair protein n=1 Tax=Aureibaculum flavum TaxID=2795986 RepID=A0ABS0WWR7_9FLAO|nr:DNA alkylation repair protein [Aureibaculum flavum]MBJ2176449.1 DNA alkylation repair protein [Aureibaculum flavum]
MSDFITTLTTEFKRQANPEIAEAQKAYMRGQFEYFGLKTPTRRAIQKPFLVKAHLPKKEELNAMVKTLWTKPQRDYHYFAQELVFKYVKQFKKEDIALLENMISYNSWWDTVDYIAVKLMGSYFKQFPEQRTIYCNKWLQTDSIWLQRAALLFQLKYKTEMDTQLLSTSINTLLGTNEFYINKAIGWVLREYSRTNPEWVIAFVDKTKLSNLSKKEALRLLK